MGFEPLNIEFMTSYIIIRQVFKIDKEATFYENTMVNISSGTISPAEPAEPGPLLRYFPY